ncbi:hypothetical protein [Aulosira sp. FACHB-615]|uniref:hypothetical protein n=1 Tax=Aulosira sp. FACHB-615 TaxID=2692777 RepID=UPI0016892FDB|nr:hypothetical protein [Aulosira sp. FACHB-615]MBD2492493.1 hypothetical protein [Aulosira sp. FACHB-615]
MRSILNSDQKLLIQWRSLLHHNVPRFVKHIKDRGGVSNEEWEWLHFHEPQPDDHKKWKQWHKDDANYPQGVLARADEYLLFPKNRQVFEQGLFVLVRALAIMAFVPGGVRMVGLHFCSEIDNFVVDEDAGET